jgi:hypothetical protein
MEQARARFSEETGKDWSPAELQAILWYFEKSVHDTFGSEQDDESPDYASAANALFRSINGNQDARSYQPSDAVKRRSLEGGSVGIVGSETRTKNEGQGKDESAYSLPPPVSMVDGLSLNATARNRNPEVRRAIFQRMLDNLAKLRRDRVELGIAFGKGYKRSMIENPRKTASIRKEAAFRENFQQPPNTGLTWRSALNANWSIV